MDDKLERKLKSAQKQAYRLRSMLSDIVEQPTPQYGIKKEVIYMKSAEIVTELNELIENLRS